MSSKSLRKKNDIFQCNNVIGFKYISGALSNQFQVF